jgi:hypothetical protein
MDAENDISLNLPQPDSQTSKDSSVHTEAFGFEPIDPIRNLGGIKGIPCLLFVFATR